MIVRGGDVGVRLATANEREVASTVTAQQKAVALSATGDQRLYGQVKSLERKGDHYELRFDPPFSSSPGRPPTSPKQRTSTLPASQARVLLWRTTTTSSTRATAC